MELFHILHFEFARDEHLDVVNVGYMFSSNPQVIEIYYGEYLFFGVALDEHGIVGLGHFKADLMKILGCL